MDLFSLGFVLLILVASGGIAYIADGLGKKLGKKRLSIKIGKRSLRPKHVAALGTVVMGVAVSFLTILFVAAVSRDAREWLIEGRGLLVEQAKLNREVKSLKAERLAEEEAKRAITTNLDQVQRQLDSAKGQVKSQRVAVDDLGRKRDRLTGELNRLNGEVSRLGGELKQTRETLRRSRGDLVAADARLADTNTRLAEVRDNLTVAQKDLRTSRHNLTTINTQRNDALKVSRDTYFQKKQLETKIEEIKKEVATREDLVKSLQEQTASLVDQRKEAEGSLFDARERYTTVLAQLDEAGARLVELRVLAESQSSFLAGTTYISRTGAMTFRAGEEVARVVVPGGADVATAANALTGLLRAARIEAQGRGGKSHKLDGKTVEVADLFERKNPKTGAVVTVDDLKRAVVSRAAGRTEDQVLVATSSYNAFTGESVSLDISVAPNPMVYRRNETVAEARIDGSLGEERILEQISEFVRSRVREKATQDRMFPRAGSPAPFGEVSTAEVWTVVRDVKKVGRSVRVQAVAENDTRAADPLKLGFRVR